MSMGVVVLMIVIAVLVMVMVVMVMVVTVVIVIAVVMVIMRGVAVRIGLRRCRLTAGVSATLGIERRFDLDHACTQTLHHRLDDVIAADAQAFGRDLRRQMAVAEMPGDPDQMVRVRRSDFEQRLRRCHDFDQPVIVEHQCVAATQRDRVFQIQQKLKPARARHRRPPPVAVVEVEHDGVGRRLNPAMLAQDSRGADHESLSF
jgi:hypothetical protein